MLSTLKLFTAFESVNYGLVQGCATCGLERKIFCGLCKKVEDFGKIEAIKFWRNIDLQKKKGHY